MGPDVKIKVISELGELGFGRDVGCGKSEWTVLWVFGRKDTGNKIENATTCLRCSLLRETYKNLCKKVTFYIITLVVLFVIFKT